MQSNEDSPKFQGAFKPKLVTGGVPGLSQRCLLYILATLSHRLEVAHGKGGLNENESQSTQQGPFSQKLSAAGGL